MCFAWPLDISFVISLIVLNSLSCSPLNPNFFIITQSYQYWRRKNKTSTDILKWEKLKHIFLFFATVRGNKHLIYMPIDQKSLYHIENLISIDIHTKAYSLAFGRVLLQ